MRPTLLRSPYAGCSDRPQNEVDLGADRRSVGMTGARGGSTRAAAAMLHAGLRTLRLGWERQCHRPNPDRDYPRSIRIGPRRRRYGVIFVVGAETTATPAESAAGPGTQRATTRAGDLQHPSPRGGGGGR
jgi:hypothetical protein